MFQCFLSRSLVVHLPRRSAMMHGSQTTMRHPGDEKDSCKSGKPNVAHEWVKSISDATDSGAP